MNRVIKIQTILTASNSEKIEALCIWIAENSDSSIGWDQLSEVDPKVRTDLMSV